MMDPGADTSIEHEGPLETQPDSISSGSLISGRGAAVSLVEKAPRLATEIEALLRTRLRAAALVLSAGLGSYLCVELFRRGPSTFANTFDLQAISLFVVLCAATIALWAWRGLSLIQLRVAELIIFGMPCAFLLMVEHRFLDSSSGANESLQGYPALSSAWFVLILLYGIFIPNTWQRAIVVVGLIVLAPYAMVWFGRLVGAAFVTNVNFESASMQVPLMSTAAGAAVYGSHLISRLRREVFEARQFGQYRLTQRLGGGGMGDVYLAEHRLLKRPCAIKIIGSRRSRDRKALVRFEREVRTTARLTHWNTVEIFDYGRAEDGLFYYVMEYLPGLTLTELVEQHGPVPAARAIHFLHQVLDALGEAHAQGFLHRDIKPGNIIVTHRGGVFDVVKLLDFGLVEAMRDLERDAETGSGELVGSPLFMSPEQALASDKVDQRSDIYSVGAVAYFLLSGHAPFEGPLPMQVLVGHARDPVRPLSELNPDLPEDLCRIVMRCLAKQPHERFGSVEAVQDSLAQCEAALTWTRHGAQAWWTEFEPQRAADDR